jgi:hypothetical protein
MALRDGLIECLGLVQKRIIELQMQNPQQSIESKQVNSMNKGYNIIIR